MKKQLAGAFCLLTSLGVFGCAAAKNQGAQNANSYRTPANGKKANKNCQLIARATKSVFNLSEPVILRVVLKNSTDDKIVYYDAYPKADFRIEGRNASGKIAFHSDYAGSVWRNILRKLPAGQKADFKLKINEFADLKVGTYFVTVRRTFVKPKDKQQRPIEITSNSVRIKLVKAAVSKP